jgi:hypothetical protein
LAQLLTKAVIQFLALSPQPVVVMVVKAAAAAGLLLLAALAVGVVLVQHLPVLVRRVQVDRVMLVAQLQVRLQTTHQVAAVVLAQ